MGQGDYSLHLTFQELFGKRGGNSSVLRRRSHGCGLSFIVRISFLRLGNFALLVSGLFHSLFVDSCVSLGGGMVLYCKEPPYI